MARLDLPDGQWIDVKDKLQVRDKRDVHTYSVDGVSSDGKTYRFNVVKHQIAPSRDVAQRAEERLPHGPWRRALPAFAVQFGSVN